VNFYWSNPGDKSTPPIVDWISEGIFNKPGQLTYGSTCMGVFENGTLVAGLAYYDQDRDAGVIQISGAATTPRWLTKKVLWEMFDFPFNQLGCQAVVMRVDPDDKRLDRILTSYGFEKTRLKRLRGRNQDEMIYTLFDDVWRSNGFHKEHTNG